MFNGFKKFIMQGNVIDLAVGVAIGGAFTALVSSLNTSFLKPLVAAATGGGKVGGTFTLKGQVFDYGAFITQIITFAITAAAIYFVVVLPINALRDRRRKEQSEPTEPTDNERMLQLLERIANK